MIKELIINWRKAEGDFADFCIEYFDDEPSLVSRKRFEGESVEVLSEVNSNALVFFERVLITVLRYIFVKKYVITEIIENVQRKLDKQISLLDVYCDNVANACNTLICGNTAKKLVLQVGFT